jgi:diacylglycerol O-acyltransferase / wax synthase
MTRFNQPLSPERDFAFGSVALDRLQAVKSAAGVTFNDMLLALWAGALRGWLSLRGELPAQPLVARVPMSLRATDATAEHGNRMAILRVALPTHLHGLHERLEAVHQASEEAKRHAAMDPAAGAAGGAVNLALTSLFGARPPQGWHGADLRTYHTMTVLNATGLAITCSTRGEVVNLGIHVDPHQVENPWAMLRAFEAALDDAEIVLGEPARQA